MYVDLRKLTSAGLFSIIIGHDVTSYVYKRHILKKQMKMCGLMSGEEKCFSHMVQIKSRGVMTLVKKDFPAKCEQIFASNEGPSLVIRVCVNDVIVTINNIYAPNHDCPSFFMMK